MTVSEAEVEGHGDDGCDEGDEEEGEGEGDCRGEGGSVGERCVEGGGGGTLVPSHSHPSPAGHAERHWL